MGNENGEKPNGFGLSRFSALPHALLMVVSPIVFCWLCYVSIHNYDGSLLLAAEDLIKSFTSGSFLTFIWSKLPAITTEGICLYYGWIIVQGLLYMLVPGPHGFGQMTPSGNILKYKCNGLNCWIISHSLLVLAVYFGLIKGTIIFENFGSFFSLANVSGVLLSCFVYFKAHSFPTHPKDRSFSGSKIADFYKGIELNPRLGDFDFKLFINGRPGILAWTLINLSCAAKQYELHGTVTNSMVLVNILHALYVLDFFCNEDWYLRTLDIAHDHFGFYLAWGSLTWLPFTYTLQSAYLVYNPVTMSYLHFVGVAALGIAGMLIFRSVNSQKDNFRKDMKNNGKSMIWGKPAKYILAKFRTHNGEYHESPLLISGWWGLSRHFNYLGDLMVALSYCLPCGFQHLLPYFYFVYMVILLGHRIYRDDVRCKQKYGKFWDRYCDTVPYRIIPYVF